MAGELSRAAKARAEKEAAAKAEADEKARLDAAAASKAAEDEEEKKKKDEEAKKAKPAAECPEDEKKKDDMDKAAKARADAPAIIRACNEAGMPALAETLVAEGKTLEEATARIEGAKDIRKLVSAAQRINPAIDAKFGDDLIAAGASAEHARAQLFDKVVSMQSPEIAARHSAGGSPASGHVAAGNNGWDDATAKVVSRFYPNLEAQRPSA